MPAAVPSWSADAAAVAPAAAVHSWEQALETEAQKLLAGGQPEVWDALTRRFESRLIRTALVATHGRRMEAAQRLGIGRNTITRKIQELGLDAPDEAKRLIRLPQVASPSPLAGEGGNWRGAGVAPSPPPSPARGEGVKPGRRCWRTG
eukprot:gene17129-35451_t